MLVSGFWVKQGVVEPRPQPHYIATDTVSINLADLARIVSLCDHPVLLQGDMLETLNRVLDEWFQSDTA